VERGRVQGVVQGKRKSPSDIRRARGVRLAGGGLRHPDCQPHVNVLPPARRTVVMHVVVAAAVHGTRSLVGPGVGVKFMARRAIWPRSVLRSATPPFSTRRHGEQPEGHGERPLLGGTACATRSYGWRDVVNPRVCSSLWPSGSPWLRVEEVQPKSREEHMREAERLTLQLPPELP